MLCSNPPPVCKCTECCRILHPLFMNTKTHSHGQPQPHRVYKRQGNSDEIETSFSEREQCDQIIHENSCTSGLYQDYVSLNERCNRSGLLSTYIQSACSVNSIVSAHYSFLSGIVWFDSYFCVVWWVWF